MLSHGTSRVRGGPRISHIQRRYEKQLGVRDSGVYDEKCADEVTERVGAGRCRLLRSSAPPGRFLQIPASSRVASSLADRRHGLQPPRPGLCHV